MTSNPKVLFCATIAEHITAFHIPTLQFLKQQGCEIHVAANSIDNIDIPYVDKFHSISISRKPFKVNNLRAYYELKKIINENNFDIIHYHIPVSAAVGRMASKKTRDKGTKIIYTAHGFKFFEGSAKVNWILYYPIEKYLAKYTDCLITINKEDYLLAKNKKFKVDTLAKINGMGVNLTRFSKPSSLEKNALREQYNFKTDDFIMIYSGEFSKRKNQQWFIELLPKLKKFIPKIHLILPGTGETRDNCIELSKKLGVENNVLFPGFVKNIENYIKLSDIGVSSSLNEGLGMHLVEDMACGKPIVASNLQGHKDLILDEHNGYLFNLDNSNHCMNVLRNLYENQDLYNKMSENTLNFSRVYSVDNSTNQIKRLYDNYLK